MDNKFYISYEAARLLKEKGYDGDAEYAYHENGNFSHWGRNVNDIDYLYAAPTKAEAIDWLDSKGIIVVLCRVTPIYICYAGEKDWSFDLELKESGKYDGFLRFFTRLEAEEAAIIKACELL